MSCIWGRLKICECLPFPRGSLSTASHAMSSLCLPHFHPVSSCNPHLSTQALCCSNFPFSAVSSMSPISILGSLYGPHLRQNQNTLYCPHIPFQIISISFLAYRKLEMLLLLAIANFSFLFSLELCVIKTFPFLLQQNYLHNRVQRSPNYCFQWSVHIGSIWWNGTLNIDCIWPTKQYFFLFFCLPSKFSLQSLLGFHHFNEAI